MEEFAAFYERYSLRIYRFLLALSGNEGQAEELTQEVFYRAFLHIESFRGQCSLFTWLCEIGKNIADKNHKTDPTGKTACGVCLVFKEQAGHIQVSIPES